MSCLQWAEGAEEAEMRTHGMDYMWQRGSSQGLKKLRTRDKWYESKLIFPQTEPSACPEHKFAGQTVVSPDSGPQPEPPP